MSAHDDLFKSAAEWGDKLKTFADEARVKAHLASKDLQDEAEGLLGEWHEFAQKAELDKSAKEIGEAAGAIGDRLKAAYERLTAAVD